MCICIANAVYVANICINIANARKAASKCSTPVTQWCCSFKWCWCCCFALMHISLPFDQSRIVWMPWLVRHSASNICALRATAIFKTTFLCSLVLWHIYHLIAFLLFVVGFVYVVKMASSCLNGEKMYPKAFSRNN